MTKKFALRFNANALLQYVLCAIIIIYGQSVWLRIGYTGGRYTILCFATVGVLAILIVSERIVSLKALQIAVILGIIFMFHSFMTGTGFELLLYRVSLPLAFFILYFDVLWRKNKILPLVEKYSNLIIMLSLVSLVLYLLGPVFNFITATKVTYYWADELKTCNTYLNFLYTPQTGELFGVTVIRNCGIFCEAPSYAVPLVISLFIEIHVKEQSNKWRVAILLLTIASTISTKAIILASIVIALKILGNTFGKDTRVSMFSRQSRMLITPILVIFLLFISLVVLGDKSDSNSYLSRMDNIYSTMLAFKDHVLFGVGAGNESGVSVYSRRVLERYGYSMGATLLLAEGGLYLTAVYIFSFVRALRRSKDKYLVVCTGIVYFGILFTSNITFFLSTIAVLALGYSMPKEPRKCSRPVKNQRWFLIK